VRAGDIALLCTALARRHSWLERDFWQRSPYLERSACEWLAAREVKAVGYDFPQDFAIRELGTARRHTTADFPAHDVMLSRDIVQIEYLVDLDRLERERVLFFAMPLKLGSVDGGPCRAFALIDGEAV
jgi:kynurenine formamidase